MKKAMTSSNEARPFREDEPALREETAGRTKAEAALAASEEQFRTLITGVQDYAIFMLSPRGIVESWNTGAERIKSYRAEEIIGQHFSRFYTPEDVAAESTRGSSLRTTAKSSTRTARRSWKP